MKTKIDTIRNDLPFTLDLREQSSREYLESKGYFTLGKIPYYIAISGIIYFIITVFLGIAKVGAYEYNGTKYNITIPENIEYMEYCYMTYSCEVDERTARLIGLNMLLIKYGYDPLYK